jgi:LmbE family N-acetylglucosaminyl deacetylase
LLSDPERLARRRARPLLVELYNALSRLTSTLTVMNTGAHPDDEQSGLLAALRFRYGMHVVIACSTRGEGGQNGIGPERGGTLGIVRTRELEEAARVLDADVAWLGFGPDDPVHDFGFSKNGADTLARWGRERLVERLVRAYRRQRPDIVIPTFLDVPGQHGHHRAMTEAAEAAIALAADPGAFPDHAREGLAPWRVRKFYLPAWPGGGGTYDDELPPPNATVLVDASGRDFATGAPYAEIGQWSRAMHATQGMGRVVVEPQASWGLHLKSGDASEGSISDGLPADLKALGECLGGEAATALTEAQIGIEAALTAFPDRTEIVAALVDVAAALERADAALAAEQRAEAGHRIARKRRETDVAILVASGVRSGAWLVPNVVSPGGEAELYVQVDSPVALSIRPLADTFIAVGDGIESAGVTRYPVRVTKDAPLTSPFGPDFDALGGSGVLGVELSAEVGGRIARMRLDLDEPAAIVPACSVTVEPEALLLPIPADPSPVEVALRTGDAGGTVALEGADGLAIRATADGALLTPSPDLAAGRYRLRATVDGVPAFRQVPISYPHVGRLRALAPAGLDVLALDLALPKGARVGYVGGGADHVGNWLARMGVAVETLDADGLAGDLARYNTIVVGIFAFGLRPDLAAATSRLHDWVRAGGHLVTLYHRPSDGWDPARTPPARLEIGSPSLRWRVSDPAAPVTVLAPDHPLLNGPNRIGEADWAGWDKERGLYFAARWDEAYVPLISLNDRGEAPLTGGLLSATLGRGRHTHTSLVLHHQMDRLVPGAFRLMANLLQPA